ncbi:hypothetical protein DOJ24_13255 [Salmonella enterica subsp. enterica]|uniref:Uncharacterized protein n=1 Tax=Salmonella enterica subsp. enterica serovar Adelaide TaxID=29473 RepID=A0A5Z9VJR3_SALET|nr:hypothetical protein CHD10_04155 [Salmonella enterica]EAA3577590.1 hypothetical protein [Salmonella enterica subsp. enterica serovar Oslo]EAA7338887.1 hypothetical protein [Salmonella enterica subsp. enterica]EAB5960343.1 hypothetical protein [Salmonella enterica subsp. enterica serovar Manchester]EAC0101334.1 hypothetical protein [Salmonella enterica subsp. arizonae]EAM3827628.1 hypothetical protein [Salmonella enterica subsp. enterica serovar Adelaide]EBH8625955.1 hypothetical protein [S
MVIHHRALQRSPCVFRATGALAALAHPSHIVNYAAGDVLACRLPVTRNPLGEGFFIFPSPGLREGRGRVVGRIKRFRVAIRHLWL